MFRLVAYKDKEKNHVLDKRHFLTEPDMNTVKSFCKEMVSQFGLDIVVETEEIRYIEIGHPQTEAH